MLNHIPICAFAAIALSTSVSTSHADTVDCIVEIEDNYSGEKYKVSKQLEYDEAEIALQRLNFPILNGQYACNLAYAGKRNGTSLACAEGSILGHNFFQSDRTGLKETSKVNNLTFRHLSSFVTLKSSCD